MRRRLATALAVAAFGLGVGTGAWAFNTTPEPYHATGNTVTVTFDCDKIVPQIAWPEFCAGSHSHSVGDTGSVGGHTHSQASTNSSSNLPPFLNINVFIAT